MVYKKYIKRGGKLYGPYVYKSVKKEGKVITQYLGPVSEAKRKIFFSKKSLSLGIVIIAVTLLFILSFNYLNFTGNVSLFVEDSYVPGENLKGELKITLEENEFIPADTRVVINTVGEEFEYLLSDLVSEEPIKGNYYIKGKDIFGNGSGYGFGDYLSVEFVLKVFSGKENIDRGKGEIEQNSSEEENFWEINETVEGIEQNESGGNEEEINEVWGVEENLEEQIEERMIENEMSDEEDILGEISDEKEVKDKKNKDLESGKEIVVEEEIEGAGDSAPITGEAVLEERVEGKVSFGDVFVYTLLEGQTAKLISSAKNIDFVIKGNQVLITTNYPKKKEFFIDIGEINLPAKEGQLKLTLIYEGVELASGSETIKVESNKTEEIINQTFEFVNNLTGHENLSRDEMLIVNETIENVSIGNISVSTIQYGAVLNRPVKWKKNVKLDKSREIKLEIPKGAENISVYKIEEVKDNEEETESNGIIGDGGSKEIVNESGLARSVNETPEIESSVNETRRISITAEVISGELTVELDLREKSVFENFFLRLFKYLTGRVIDVEEKEESTEVTIDDNATEFEIEYETPAPFSVEKNTSYGKEILISSYLHYTNILAYTELPYPVLESQIKLYNIINGTQVLVDFVGYEVEDIEANETNVAKIIQNESGIIGENVTETRNSLSITGQVVEDGVLGEIQVDRMISYIEWVVPHLSNQSYELVIEITKAEHLNSNRSFISDIYEEVKTRDDNWSEIINDGEYVRVTFEVPLDNTRDITLYARSNENASIEVYEQDGEEVVAVFDEISDENWYKIYLTELNGTQEIFDLKVLGSVEFDYIVDPATEYNVSFVAPTPSDGFVTTNTSVEINVSILNATDLDEVIWNWDGTNFTMMNDSLVLMYNFDNVSALGENETYVFDVSGNNHNGTLILNNDTTGPDMTGGKYGGGFYFDGDGDYINVSSASTFPLTGPFTFGFWIKMEENSDTYAIFSNYHWQGEPYAKSVLIRSASGVVDLYVDPNTGDANYDQLIPTNTLDDGNWHYYTGVFYADGLKRVEVYYDGINQSGTYYGSAMGALDPSSDPITIGTWGWTNPKTFTDYFKGHLDDFKIWNRSLSQEEIYEQYVSSLYKYDTDKWVLYVNQSKNATDVFDFSSYTYQAFVGDGSDLNYTEERTININFPPTVNSVNVTPSSPSSSDALFGYCNASDSNNDSISYRYQWYKDDVLNVSGTLFREGSISTGSMHTCGIRANDSRVLCWGRSYVGALGDGGTSDNTIPTLINDTNAYLSVSAGNDLTCGIRANDSRVLCWGEGSNYQIGNNNNQDKVNPTLTSDTTAYLSVSAGYNAVCGIRANDSRILCWGKGQSIYANVLGNDSDVDHLVPELTNDASAYLSVSMGIYHVCGIRAKDSRVLCWGDNQLCQMGDEVGCLNSNSVPGLTSDTSAYLSLEAGAWHTCGIRANDSRVLCWGYGDSGQLGDGIITNHDVGIPNLTVDTNAYLSISPGFEHTCGIRANDSRVLCWGKNDAYQLGNGGTTDTGTPTLVNDTNAYTFISGGFGDQGDATCGIRANDSRVLCWGESQYSQMGGGGSGDNEYPFLVNDVSAYSPNVVTNFGSRYSSVLGINQLVNTLPATSTSAAENWTFSCSVYDGISNSTWLNSSGSYILDSTAPTITIATPSNGSYSNNTGLDVNYLAIDNVALDSCWYSNDTMSVNTSLGTTCDNITSVVWTEGQHNVTIWANDSSSNNGSASVSFTIDLTYPLIDYDVSTSANGSVSNGEIFVNVSVTESNVANITFLLHNSTGEVNSTTYTDSTRTINWTGLSEGNYTFNVTIFDEVGYLNITATRTFTIDTTYPLIDYGEGTEANASSKSQTNIYVNISVTEIHEENLTFYLFNSSFDNLNTTTYTDNSRTVNWSGLGEGVYYYNVTIYDSANNFNSTSTRTITLDTTSPVVLNGSGMVGDGSIGVESTFFNWTVTDNFDTNLSCYPTYVGSVEDSDNLVYTVNGTYESVTRILQGGQHVLNITCYDNANNSGQSTGISYLVGEINISSPITNNRTSSIVRFNTLTNFTIDEISGQDYFTNLTLFIQNSTDTLEQFNLIDNGDYYNLSHVWGNYSQPFNVTITAVAYNGSIGISANVTDTISLVYLREEPGGITLAPSVTSAYPNRTYNYYGNSTKISLIADLDTIFFSDNLTVKDPDNISTQLTADESLLDQNDFFNYLNYTLTLSKNGTYTIYASVQDYEGTESTTWSYNFYTTPNSRQVVLNDTRNISVFDIGNEEKLWDATDLLITIPENALYDVEINVTNTFKNISVMFRDVNLSNMTEVLNYTDLTTENDAPSGTRRIDLFDLESNLNYTSYDLVIDYSKWEPSITEANLRLYKCSNISNCVFELLTTSLNTTLNTITSISVSSMSRFMLAEPVTVVTETVTVSTTTGGGGGTTVVYNNIELVTPGKATMELTDEIVLPIIVKNPIKDKILKGLKFSAVSNTEDLSMGFDKDKINSLAPLSEENINMIINSHSTPGDYEIILNATVDSPKITETSRIYIKLVENLEGDFVKERVVLVQDLFKENPDCLEFNDYVLEAEQVLESEPIRAKDLLQYAINSCKELITLQESEFKQVVSTLKKQWEKPVVVASVLFAVAMIIVMIVLRGKTRKRELGKLGYGGRIKKKRGGFFSGLFSWKKKKSRKVKKSIFDR